MYNVSKHERLRPLLRNCVVIRFVCSVDDGNAVGVASGNEEDDTRPLETAPRVLLHCDGQFRRWSSSAKVYSDEAEA